MSAQNNFITIQEAVVFTKKSEKTIRRLAKGLVTENEVTGQVASQDTDKLRVENKNGKHFYSLSRPFLIEQFDLSRQNERMSGHEENLSGHTTSHEQQTTGHVSGQAENMTGHTTRQEEKTAEPQGLERYCSFLEGQVRVKDDQIKNFQERDKEHNILISRLQEQVFLLDDGKQKPNYEHVVYQSAPKQREEEEGIEDDFESGGGVASRSREEPEAKEWVEEKPQGQEKEEVKEESGAAADEEQETPGVDGWTEEETPVTDEGLAAAAETAEEAVVTEQFSREGETAVAAELTGVAPSVPVQPQEERETPTTGISEQTEREAEAAAPVAATEVSSEQGAGEGSEAAPPPTKKKGFWRRVFGG